MKRISPGVPKPTAGGGPARPVEQSAPTAPVKSARSNGPGSTFRPAANAAPNPSAVRLGPEQAEVNRLQPLLRGLLDGAEPSVSAQDLRRLQAAALQVADRLFTDAFGTDGELKAQLRAKKPAYGDVAPSEQLERALFNGSAEDRQLDALALVLRTFRSPSDGALRAAALSKLGELGRPKDVEVALLAARQGDAADLYNGVQAAQRIAARHGSPPGRAFGTAQSPPLSQDPVIGPLLSRSQPLNDQERAQVLEAVLSRGQIDLEKTRKHRGENRNEVYFLTFKESLPGPGGTREPIRAVWKPENVWFNKDRAYWAREVAAYEFDKAFTQTGLVPPTVESIIALDGKDHRVGSLQWMVADARPLGKNVTEFDPRFDALRGTDAYQQQEAKMRTLLYIFNDPDKLPNNVHSTANLQNVMIDKNDRLWMIDNAYSMGAPAGTMDRSFLPPTPDPQLAGKLDPLDPAQVASTMGRFVRKSDAQDVAHRADKATEDP